MQIETLKTKDLIPYGHNPKTHPPEQVEKIARSLKEFGFRAPILIDAENVIIAGHGRLLAARHLGLEQVPVIRATDMPPEQIRAYRIADNKLSELGAWDWQAMAEDFTLEELAALSPSIGMTKEDLNQFMDAAHRPLTPEEATQAADHAAAEEPMTDFERQMQEPVEPKMAIVPQYCEDYEAFIIVCKNTVDEAYIRQALGLNELAKNYADSKIKRPNILTVEQFKKKWESRS